MNANAFLQKDYENISDWTLGENKPNSKPNKANFTYPQRNALIYAEGGKTEVRCRFSEVRYLPSVFCPLFPVTSLFFF